MKKPDFRKHAMEKILALMDDIDSKQFKKIYQSKPEEPENRPEDDEDEAEYLALAEKD